LAEHQEKLTRFTSSQNSTFRDTEGIPLLEMS